MHDTFNPIDGQRPLRRAACRPQTGFENSNFDVVAPALRRGGRHPVCCGLPPGRRGRAGGRRAGGRARGNGCRPNSDFQTLLEASDGVAPSACADCTMGFVACWQKVRPARHRPSGGTDPGDFISLLISAPKKPEKRHLDARSDVSLAGSVWPRCRPQGRSASF